MNVTDLLNSKALIQKCTEDFVECYKTQLHMVGITPNSDAEKLMITCLANAAKVWANKVKYNKILYGGK